MRPEESEALGMGRAWQESTEVVKCSLFSEGIPEETDLSDPVQNDQTEEKDWQSVWNRVN